MRGRAFGRARSPSTNDAALWKAFSAIFVSVFLAKVGDKTQLATMLFASEAREQEVARLRASASALVWHRPWAVLAGAQIERFVKPSTLNLIRRRFIVIGLWTMLCRG